MSHKPMSMEAVMDEERREVLALLERPAMARRASSIKSSARSESPYSNPRSPLRSPISRILDYDDLDAPPTVPEMSSSPRQSPRPAPAQPIRSMLDIGGPPPIRSMLDVGGGPPLSGMPPLSAQTSPTEPLHRHHPRSNSDASGRPTDLLSTFSLQSRNNPVAAYQFADILTNRENPRPKRSSLGGSSKPNARGSSMKEVMRGSDVSNMKLPGHGLPLHGRPLAPHTASHSKSRSPHSRLSVRSKSPGLNMNTRALSPAGAAFLADNNMDYNNAYRKLSDAKLMSSGGTLGSITQQRSSRASEDKSLNIGRLQKDYIGPNGEELNEDSSDDNDSSSDDEDDGRGRPAARSFTEESHKTPSVSTSPNAERRPAPKSLLAAAEEERVHVSTQNQAYRSLFEPDVVVTSPSGEKSKPDSNKVVPVTSFDPRSANESDEEAQIEDIKRAQNLKVTMTPIMKTPGAERSVRIIYRGDWDDVQKKVEEEHRRARKYIVATDLSEESTHALEWAVGTVLRNGDTMIAIYCVDEETGIPMSAEDEAQRPGRNATGSTPTLAPATLAVASASSSTSASRTSQSPSPFSRQASRNEEERQHAINDITDRVTRLLRKTYLEVRVIVEVLHCKTPKHMLTEVIDMTEPTMVILGSRGRSNLKGVILGSFSNYLVTKSSAPVMVARKRLRKQGKYRQTSTQVNNLNNPSVRSLVNAKID